MKHYIITLAILALSMFAAQAQPSEKDSFAYGDTVRTYAMYIPDNIEPGAPLVVYAHGYGSKTRWRNDLNETAAKYGFAVCYPDGAPDTRGKDSWYVGYPTQGNMDKCEARFFAALLDEVCAKHKLSRDNVFLTGMSNGGELCFMFAYMNPTLFRAYASVSGLTMEWLYNEHKLNEPVHFMEIHGNADPTSWWNGDHENKGGWGEYLPVPIGVGAVVAANRCATMKVDSIPALSDSTRMVIRTHYGDAPSGKDVVLYEVQGGKHTWQAKDVSTSEIIWNFFRQMLK